MIEFLLSNPEVVYTVGVLLILVLGFLLRKLSILYTDGKIAKVMLAVEKNMSTWAKNQASGLEKRDKAISIVVNKVYPLLPSWMKIFISKSKLIDAVDKVYVEMLDFLDDGKLNDSIK